jgi:L-cystine transport system substrate-binding protein
MSTEVVNWRRLYLLAVGAAATLFVAAAPDVSRAEVRVIQVTTCGECKPLSWGALGEEPQGYEPDVLRAIDAKLPQYKFELTGLPDAAQQTGLVTGKYDISAGGYIKSAEREEQFYIPDSPTGTALLKIYSRSEDHFNDLKDLVGKKLVPSDAGGGTYRFLTEWQAANPQYKIDFSASSAGIPIPYRLQEIDNGKFDAWVYPANIGQNEIIAEQKLNVVASEPVKIANHYFLISKKPGNDVLRDDIAKAITELREDGTLSQLSNKWFGEDITKYIQ